MARVVWLLIFVLSGKRNRRLPFDVSDSCIVLMATKMNTIRCFKWQLSYSLKAWKTRNTYLPSRAILWPPFDYEEEWKLPKMLFIILTEGCILLLSSAICMYRRQNFDLLPCRSLRCLPFFLFLMDIDLNSFRWEKGLGKLKMGSETRTWSVRSFQAIFLVFFLVSSITTQQFNNPTSSSMTMY